MTDGFGARYREPGAPITAIVDAEHPPVPRRSPDRNKLAWLHWESLPSIAELTRPYHKLAGLRVMPETRSRRRTWYFTQLDLQDVDTGNSTTIPLPAAQIRFSHASWSPDGQYLVLCLFEDRAMRLAVLHVASGRVDVHEAHAVTDFLGAPFLFLPDGHTLLLRTVPTQQAPIPPAAPTGPMVQSTSERLATNRTYQDLLENGYDDALFEHFATTQLVEFSLRDHTWREVGVPAMWAHVSASPDGRFLLTSTLQTPFSRVVPYHRFARNLDIRDREANVVHRLASQPAVEEIPIQGVRMFHRSVRWQPLCPASLFWVEALDKGDPNNDVPFRDAAFRLTEPFDQPARALFRVQHRYRSAGWLDRPDEVLISEYDRDERWVTTRHHQLVESARFEDTPPGRVVMSRSIKDRYNDPGRAVTRRLPTGQTVIETTDDEVIHLVGDGASPSGDQPFLDRWNLRTDEKSRVFESERDAYSTFVGFSGTSADGPGLLIRRESPHSPPNLFHRRSGRESQLSFATDPHPELTGVTREILKFQRADGVPLYGTLYLPPGGLDSPAPTLIWAYPTEYNDPDTAGQVRATPNRFTRLSGTSPLMFLAKGWPVLVASMPVVGDPETANDTFVAQISDAATAAVDALVACGASQRDRIGVAGHSYGAFMVAHLLANTSLFRAGIARSGAYNRTMTPFGFQNERRTLWQAPDTYVALSPLFAAHKIDAPLLLLHGAEDNNTGTWTLQSRRLYHALEGLGATARLVLLPGEGHGYAARESVLHVLAEMLEWFEAWVVQAP